MIWGNPVLNLRSRVWMDNPTIAVGQPIFVRYAIQNVAKEANKVWHTGFWNNHRVVVLGKDDKELSLTPLGLQKRNAFNPSGPREKAAPVTLAPNAIDDAWEQIDLQTLFIFPDPGEYSVQITYQPSAKVSGIVSNRLAFTLKR